MSRSIDVYELQPGDVFMEDDGHAEEFEALRFEQRGSMNTLIAKPVKGGPEVSFGYTVAAYAPDLHLIREAGDPKPVDNKLPDKPCEAFVYVQTVDAQGRIIAEPPPGCIWHTWLSDTFIYVQTIDAQGRITALFRSRLDGIHPCEECKNLDIPADYRLTRGDGAHYFCRHHTLRHPDFGIEDYCNENKWEAIRFLPQSVAHLPAFEDAHR